MLTIRVSRRQSARESIPAPAPAVRRRPPAQPLWSSDGVLWGVVREESHFDMHDTAYHRGLVQHAYPMGRDWLAACGFRTPLQRAFDGVRRPLLAMPGVHNRRCESCQALIIPAVRPDLGPGTGVGGPAAPTEWIQRRLEPPPPMAADPRPLRPAIPIPVGAPSPGHEPATASWPAADRKPALVEERLHVIEVWRRTARAPEQVMEAVHVETAGPVGRRAFMEVDRAERVRR